MSVETGAILRSHTIDECHKSAIVIVCNAGKLGMSYEYVAIRRIENSMIDGIQFRVDEAEKIARAMLDLCEQIRELQAQDKAEFEAKR